MQAVLALPGVARRWSGLVTLIMLSTTVTLVRWSTIPSMRLGIGGAYTPQSTFFALHPHLGWDYYGFLMNGRGSPSPRWPQFGDGTSLAAGLGIADETLRQLDRAGGGLAGEQQAGGQAEASPLNIPKSPAEPVLAAGAGGTQDKGSAPSARRDSFTPRPVRPTPGLYRMSINPVRPDSGITTGLVVAYGHILQPPYRVEARGESVFVNGVRVDPPIRPQGLIEQEKRHQESLAARPPAIRAHEDSIALMVERVRRTYDSLLPSLGHQRAYDAAVTWLMQHPMVESIQTIGSRVKAYLKDGHETGVMTLATYPDLLLARPGAVPWKPEDRVIRRAASIATQLVGGRAELFCWGISQSMPGDGLGEIKRILADPKLSDNEKYYLLKTKASAAAAAFLDNYDPSEWFIVEDDTSRGLILPSSPEPGTAVAVDATPPVVPGAVSAAGWMPCWGAYHVSNQDAMKGAFDLIKDELEKHGFTFSGLYNGNNIDYFDDLLDREDGYWFLATHGHGDGVLVETCGSYQGAIAEFQNSENSGENSGEFREFRGHNKRFLTPGGVLVRIPGT